MPVVCLNYGGNIPRICSHGRTNLILLNSIPLLRTIFPELLELLCLLPANRLGEPFAQSTLVAEGTTMYWHSILPFPQFVVWALAPSTTISYQV